MSGNVKGAALITVAVLLLTINDGFVKALSATLPVGQIMALRGLVVVLLVGLINRAIRSPARPREVLHPWVLARGALEALVVVLYLAGVALLPLAVANALIYSSPVFSTALAALVLRERVGVLRWFALVLGLLGVVVISDPHGGSLGPAALLPIAGAVVLALADLVNRRLDPAISTGSVLVTTTGAIALAGAALMLADRAPVGPGAWLMLPLAALFLASGYACLIAGLRLGELSFTTPFRYQAIPIAIALGWAVWGEIPDLRTWAGAALITAGGVLLVVTGRAAGRA